MPTQNVAHSIGYFARSRHLNCEVGISASAFARTTSAAVNLAFQRMPFVSNVHEIDSNLLTTPHERRKIWLAEISINTRRLINSNRINGIAVKNCQLCSAFQNSSLMKMRFAMVICSSSETTHPRLARFYARLRLNLIE